MTGQEYAEAWEAIQNELQYVWGFDVNKDFHMFWQMKGCTPVQYTWITVATTQHTLYSYNLWLSCSWLHV